MKNKTRCKLKVTSKQQEARDLVDRFRQEKGYPPSYREIANLLNVASVNTAYVRLRGYRHKMVKN